MGHYASEATFLGLLAKELYWDFKTELELLLQTDLIANYFSETNSPAAVVVEAQQIGYK